MLMALDHLREFMTMAPFDPLDPAKTSLSLYLTRWVTHFCAPVFIFWLARARSCISSVAAAAARYPDFSSREDSGSSC